MHTLRTRSSVRTKTAQVELAQLFADVFSCAARTQGAEAALVVRTGGELGDGVHVQVETFIAAWAVAVASEEIAFRHFAPATC